MILILQSGLQRSDESGILHRDRQIELRVRFRIRILNMWIILTDGQWVITRLTGIKSIKLHAQFVTGQIQRQYFVTSEACGAHGLSIDHARVADHNDVTLGFGKTDLGVQLKQIMSVGYIDVERLSFWIGITEESIRTKPIVVSGFTSHVSQVGIVAQYTFTCREALYRGHVANVCSTAGDHQVVGVYIVRRQRKVEVICGDIQLLGRLVLGSEVVSGTLTLLLENCMACTPGCRGEVTGTVGILRSRTGTVVVLHCVIGSEALLMARADQHTEFLIIGLPAVQARERRIPTLGIFGVLVFHGAVHGVGCEVQRAAGLDIYHTTNGAIRQVCTWGLVNFQRGNQFCCQHVGAETTGRAVAFKPLRGGNGLAV